MSRKNRNLTVHSIYHVMVRGNHKQAIFYDNEHRNKFLDLLKNCKEKFQCEVLLYCLMTNHVHLVIKTGVISLSTIMISLTSRFAKYMNSVIGKPGHLFQQRFVSKEVFDENYLLGLCFYIHKNPIKAKMVVSIDDYTWSSHHGYKYPKKDLWLSKSLVMKAIEKNYKMCGGSYEQLMSRESMSKEIAKKFEIGDDGQITIVDEIIKQKEQAAREDFSLLSIHDYIQCVSEVVSIDKNLLAEPCLQRKVVLSRALIAYFAHYYGRYTIKHISTYFAQDPNSLSRNMHKSLKLETSSSYIKQIILKLRMLHADKKYCLAKEHM